MKSPFLALALLRPFVLAAPYIVTNYVELSIYTDAGYTESDYTQPPTTETETYLVTPATTPFSPLQTFTADTRYSDLTIIDVVLPTGVGNEISVDLSGLATSYVVPITYLPSATRSQNWTFTIQVPVYIPFRVSLSAVSLSTSVTTDTYVYYDLKPTPTTNIIAILNPTDIDTGDLASASSYNEPYGLSYCYTPTTYCTTIAASSTCTPTFVYDSSSNYEGGYYGDESYDGYYWQVILIAVLVPVSWILIWLMVGLWESWLSFKGVMLGLHRKRGLPYAWCCVSIFFLCCVGPAYKAKSAEEQAELLEKWNAMKKREKFKLWMKWGFRWKYPDMLGDEPEFAKRPPRQGCL